MNTITKNTIITYTDINTIITECNNKLSLSGGTITGTIYFDDVGDISYSNNSDYRTLWIDRDNGNAIGIFDTDSPSNPGTILLRANDGSRTSDFWLYPNGTATLGGHSVLTSAGGTLTGQIKKASGSIISCTSDASYLSINGGTDYKHGARIVLSGKDTSGWTGELQLEAHDGTNGNVLRIFPSGEATLGGKYFVHSVNGVNASAAGDVRGMPAGSVIAFAGNSTPAGGFLLCNGAAVSRTTYAALFAAIGTTYGTGNGSTTFNLPNLTDKFIQGSGTAGTVKAAGLPNATGALPNTFSGGTETVNTTSALYFGASGARVYTYSDSGYNAQISLNLSRASSIYGNSTTVQPPALTMRYYIKY